MRLLDGNVAIVTRAGHEIRAPGPGPE